MSFTPSLKGLDKTDLNHQRWKLPDKMTGSQVLRIWLGILEKFLRIWSCNKDDCF